MIKIKIPMRLNQYGNPVINWEHWSVKFRVWLSNISMPYFLWSWLYDRRLIIYGDAEDCWVGGWELGEDD